VTTLGTADGETRFRVRVGPFPSRAEAERTAQRMRAARSLPTYVAAD
jgi:cell division protein FtsN